MKSKNILFDRMNIKIDINFSLHVMFSLGTLMFCH